jgi:hypothetical protein
MFARATANQTAKRFTLLSLHEVTSAFLKSFHCTKFLRPELCSKKYKTKHRKCMTKEQHKMFASVTTHWQQQQYNAFVLNVVALTQWPQILGLLQHGSMHHR